MSFKIHLLYMWVLLIMVAMTFPIMLWFLKNCWITIFSSLILAGFLANIHLIKEVTLLIEGFMAFGGNLFVV